MGKSVRERRRTVLNFKLDINDSGELLSRLGMPGVVRKGNGKVEGQVAWAGSPITVDYPSMSGKFNVNVETGQFLKAEPGIAKLLGVLSLQALPRRLTLDFRDVFSEGFSFDFVRGDMLIDQGVASTNNLQMKGVNAAVLMEGRADLARETQDLKVVVVPDINVSDQELDRWHALGVRGARFNLLQIDGKPMYRNGVGLEVLKKLAPKFAERGWHAQIWAHAPDLPELAPQLLPLGLPLVIDHMGRMNTSHGLNNPGFQFLCKLLSEGKGWVKISGADRIGNVKQGYQDVDPFAKALLAANPENVVWGTDWPHINYFDAALVPDDGALVNLLSRWLDKPADLERVLVSNPARLYGFPKA